MNSFKLFPKSLSEFIFIIRLCAVAGSVAGYAMD